MKPSTEIQQGPRRETGSDKEPAYNYIRGLEREAEDIEAKVSSLYGKISNPVLANLKPAGTTDVAACLHRVATMARGKSLIMVFSDLLTEPGPVIQALHHHRHRGNEVILFHILDEAEVKFPFEGVTEFEDPETREKLPPIDARGMRQDYQAAVEAFRQQYREECAKANIDYVPMDTSVTFDRALMEYLLLGRIG